MPARLVPLTEGLAPIVALQRPVLLIGRHPECDVRIDLPQVSRRHCCVALAYDRLVIRDLGSRHGLRVNGRLVEEARLTHGDEVAIAQVLFRLDDPRPVTPPSPPPTPPATIAAPAAVVATAPAPSPAPAAASPNQPGWDDGGWIVPLPRRNSPGGLPDPSDDDLIPLDTD